MLLSHVALGHLGSVDDAATLVRVTEVVHPDRDAARFYRRRVDEPPENPTDAATGHASKEEMP